VEQKKFRPVTEQANPPRLLAESRRREMMVRANIGINVRPGSSARAHFKEWNSVKPTVVLRSALFRGA
jgi:hypothetical protein